MPKQDGSQPLLKVPSELLSQLRQNPLRAPEQLALAAVQIHGPYAQRWVQERSGMYSVSQEQLAKMAKKQHAGLARFSGAATGIGGILTVVPDLAALAWIQSRMILCIAASYGFNPNDPMRPAELLVLQGIYPDPQSARNALDGTGTGVVEQVTTNRLDGNQTLTQVLLRMIGKRGAKKLGTKAIPGFAVVANAVGNEQNTRELALRTIDFYGG